MNGPGHGAPGKPGAEHSLAALALEPEGSGLAGTGWALMVSQCLCVLPLGEMPCHLSLLCRSHGAQEVAGGDWLPRPTLCSAHSLGNAGGPPAPEPQGPHLLVVAELKD